jgi:hypothetical protein
MVPLVRVQPCRDAVRDELENIFRKENKKTMSNDHSDVNLETAHHEAAHAVISLEPGLRLGRVTIQEDARLHVAYNWVFDRRRRSRQ